MALDSVHEHDFVTVTEHTALAAAQTMGCGDPRRSAETAIHTMRETLDEMGIRGRVVLDTGTAQTAAGKRKVKVDTSIDLALDPLEGIALCASGSHGALSALAAAEPGGLLQLPAVDMEKIVVGPSASGAVHLDAPVPENLRNIARVFQREVSDLTVVVLERERHQQLVKDIRRTGARIRLIRDAELSAAVSAALRGTAIHALMGLGSAQTGVLIAAAMRCLGGSVQARFSPADDTQKELLQKAGVQDSDRIYSTEDLAPAEQILFSATGVTDGQILRGVRFFGGGSRTSSLWMSRHRRTVRFIETVHQDDVGLSVHIN